MKNLFDYKTFLNESNKVSVEETTTEEVKSEEVLENKETTTEEVKSEEK